MALYIGLDEEGGFLLTSKGHNKSLLMINPYTHIFLHIALQKRKNGTFQPFLRYYLSNNYAMLINVWILLNFMIIVGLG